MKKAMPWFRMYTDFLNDPKMITLAFEDQRHFIGVLALKGSGTLDQACDKRTLDRIVAQRLWVDFAIVEDVKKRLIAVDLIDTNWQPVAWDKRQFTSDQDPTGADRARRYRASRVTSRTDNGTVTPPDTEADTETETEQKNTYPTDFENVWQVYPSRPGRSKAAAYKAWRARIKAGDTPEAMTTGVIAYAAYCKALATDPQYIRQPETFFGPSRHFASDWMVQKSPSKGSSLNLLPPNSPRIREIRADNQDEWPDWMRDDVEVAHAG